MTTSNHILAGTLIAVIVKDPVYVIPLALMSHFVLDAFPHFGVNDTKYSVRVRFRYYLKMEIFGLIGIAILLSTGLYGWNLITLASFLAVLPDLEWPARYFIFEYRGKNPPKTFTSKYHKKIQWCERKWGVFPEITYFALGFALLINIT